MTTTTKAFDTLGRYILHPRGTATDYLGRSVKASNKDYLGRTLVGVAATGATAGTPGAWTPTDAVAPPVLSDITGGQITASPGTAWTTGQKVALRGGSFVHWNSTAWVAGAA